MSAIANLKKLHQAMAVTSDTYSMITFLKEHAVKGIAPLDLIGIESKYVARFDKRDAPAGTEGAGSLGFRTRFMLSNGETIGTFSNAAHYFLAVLAEVTGHDPEEKFLQINFEGLMKAQVESVELDKTRSTYEFELIEEGSTFSGMAALDQKAMFLGTSSNVALPEGSAQDDPTPPDEPSEEEEKQSEEEQPETTTRSKRSTK